MLWIIAVSSSSTHREIVVCKSSVYVILPPIIEPSSILGIGFLGSGEPSVLHIHFLRAIPNGHQSGA